jgi:DNA-directed RNA polymerase specialized sigma24 family protein
MTPSSLTVGKKIANDAQERARHTGELHPYKPTSDIEKMMEWGEYPTPQEADWDIIDIVESCLDQVPEPHRTLLKLRFFDKYSYNKMTEIMGYSGKSHTWYHVQKALKMLEEILRIDPTIRKKYDDKN